MSHDPGGKISIWLPPDVQGSAVFGGDLKQYRYRLTRIWGSGARVMFVMMNPSTADPAIDDPTVAKCRRFAEKWGYGSLNVGNTFAYRATDQGRLKEIPDPVGIYNDDHLLDMASECAIVVFAYGKPKHAALRGRGKAVVNLLLTAGHRPHVLRLSKDGTPWHPLYLPETLEPVLWEP